MTVLDRVREKLALLVTRGSQIQRSSGECRVFELTVDLNNPWSISGCTVATVKVQEENSSSFCLIWPIIYCL
jgi:hypothetical protein